MTLTNAQTRLLFDVRLFLDADPLRRIPINEITQRFNLSKDKLMRGFKELFSVTVYDYQIQVAMHHAKILLQKGENIKNVSAELGYSTRGSFTRAFFRALGRTPSSVRDENSSQ